MGVLSLASFPMPAGIGALIYLSGALDAESQLGVHSTALESNIRGGLLGAVGVFLGAQLRACALFKISRLKA